MSPSSTRSIPISGSITFLNWSRTRSSVNTLSPLFITLQHLLLLIVKAPNNFSTSYNHPEPLTRARTQMFEACYLYVWPLSHIFHFIHRSSCLIHNILWITSRCADRGVGPASPEGSAG